MQRPTESQRQHWMNQWRRAAVNLARVRVEETSRIDLARVASDLEDASLAAAPARARAVSSGLVAQQRWFRRQRSG